MNLIQQVDGVRFDNQAVALPISVPLVAQLMTFDLFACIVSNEDNEIFHGFKTILFNRQKREWRNP